MKLRIDADDKTPIYVQIEGQVKAMVAAGQLRPGEQLPTIRQLAADLRVNYNTIARAYMDLDRDGVISTMQGRGTFVTGVLDKEQAARVRAEKLRSIMRSAVQEALQLGYSPNEIQTAFGDALDQ